MAALPLVAEDRGISVEEVRDWSSNMLWPVEARAGRPAAGSLLQTSSCLRPPGQCPAGTAVLPSATDSCPGKSTSCVARTGLTCCVAPGARTDRERWRADAKWRDACGRRAAARRLIHRCALKLDVVESAPPAARLGHSLFKSATCFTHCHGAAPCYVITDAGPHSGVSMRRPGAQKQPFAGSLKARGGA